MSAAPGQLCRPPTETQLKAAAAAVYWSQTSLADTARSLASLRGHSSAGSGIRSLWWKTSGSLMNGWPRWQRCPKCE